MMSVAWRCIASAKEAKEDTRVTTHLDIVASIDAQPTVRSSNTRSIGAPLCKAALHQLGVECPRDRTRISKGDASGVAGRRTS